MAVGVGVWVGRGVLVGVGCGVLVGAGITVGVGVGVNVGVGLGGSAVAVGGDVAVAVGTDGMGASAGDRAASGCAGAVRTAAGSNRGVVQANAVVSITANKATVAYSLTGVALPTPFFSITYLSLAILRNDSHRVQAEAVIHKQPMVYEYIPKRASPKR